MLANMFAHLRVTGESPTNIIGGTVRWFQPIFSTMDNVPAADTVIDVREIDGEPFGDIMDALEDLENGETLRLTAEFEPVPLYGVLEGKGYAHETSQAGGAYHVMIQSV